MNLFLDDMRVPGDVTWVALPRLPKGEDWLIIRSHKEFCAVLDDLALSDHQIKRVAFDHDLSDEHYGEDYSNANTGYDSALYLAQVLIDTGWPIPEYVVHSLNPTAKGRIDGAINDVRCFRELN